MTYADELGRTILRNMLLGRWAADRLGMSGRDAEAYVDVLARGAADPELGDVFGKIRRDFDAAGVAATDEQILSVIAEFTIKAGGRMSQGRGDSLDTAAMMLKRNLTSR